MTNQPNFDALAEKFFAARGEETYCELFGAVFELPSWHFIVDSQMPNLSPYCAIFPDFFDRQPLVLAFTDTDKLNQYVTENNLQIGSENQSLVLNSNDAAVKVSSENLIISVPTTSAIDFVEQLTERGVKGVFFNPNKQSHGFPIGLSQLRETKELVESKKTKTESEQIAARKTANITVDFDSLSKKANESGGAMEDLNSLFGAVYALDEWIFIARGEMPNVYPYIASNAGYANGQQMIRAFTDANRLQRFAKQNNLTKPDGSVLELTVPTKGIIDYLEQFTAQGVHGIWFNSDTESDGFFIPLKQLRPIKEHLAKLQTGNIAKPSVAVPPADSSKPTDSQTVLETIIVIFKDGLMLPSGFVKKSDYTCNLYCLAPRDWTEGEQLKEIYLEKFLKKMYGETWRDGNSDGSCYVVENSFSQILTDKDLKGANWTTTRNTAENHFWFYVVGANSEIVVVNPSEFQKEFETSRQINAKPQIVKNSNLEDYGFTKSSDGSIQPIYVTPEGETFTIARDAQKTALQKWVVRVSPGETDSEIKFISPGNVKFGITLVPFYAAITQRLKDYQGSGDFGFIFNFAPESVLNLTENITSNDHGTYFRVRKFQYHAPNADVADVATIDSNELRHIQTGAKLSMSFVLMQVPESNSAALYFGMQGNANEIEKLLQALTPALEGAGFLPEKS